MIVCSARMTHHRVIGEIRLADVHPSKLGHHGLAALHHKGVLHLGYLTLFYSERFVCAMAYDPPGTKFRQLDLPWLLVGEENRQPEPGRLVSGVQDDKRFMAVRSFVFQREVVRIPGRDVPIGKNPDFGTGFHSPASTNRSSSGLSHSAGPFSEIRTPFSQRRPNTEPFFPANPLPSGA